MIVAISARGNEDEQMNLRDVWNVAGAVIVSLGGGAVLIFALSSWLGKVWAARILEEDRRRYGGELEVLKSKFQGELARLRGDIDKAVYVHRVQFEKEFSALSEIWNCVAKLRTSFEVLALRKRDESNDVEWRQQVEEFFVPRFTALLEAVDRQSPFYPQEIHDALSDAIQLARSDHTLALTERPKDVDDYYKLRIKARRDFEAKAISISDRIRARLASLVVLEQEAQ